MAVNDQKTIRLIGDNDDHDRTLLPGSGKRGQQPALSLGISCAQMFVPAVQLVKFQFHSVVPPAPILDQTGSRIASNKRQVCQQPLQNQRHKP